MSWSDIIGESISLSTARVGQVVEIEEIRMVVERRNDDHTLLVRDRMAHRRWVVPASTRGLIFNGG